MSLCCVGMALIALVLGIALTAWWFIRSLKAAGLWE